MQNYNLKPVNSGNTYKGAKFTLPSEQTYSLTGATILMQVRDEFDTPVVATFTLTKLSEYQFSIPPQVINIKAGTYNYDILIIFADGRKKTYIGGEWTIEPVVTRR